MNVLVLQPVKPNHPPALRRRADELIERMIGGANSSMSFDVWQDDRAIECVVTGSPSQYWRHATIRNVMLEAYLKPEHERVLWVDDDLIDYPANLPTLLHEANPGGITAPLALLADTPGRRKHDPMGRRRDERDSRRFYDIGGFVEEGHSARVWPPFFDQVGDIVELDSVGCCYLAPADLYRDDPQSYIWRTGVRYAPPERDSWFDQNRPGFGHEQMEFRVEHNSVMAQAKARGIRVCCLTTVVAIHAWLPDYGLDINL